jgi:hypothetical protein
MNYNKIGVLLLFSIMFWLFCQKSGNSVSKPTKSETEGIVKIGDTVVVQLMSNLKGELMKAIEEGGMVNAISVCKTKALELTSEVGRKVDPGIEIKRTTSNYRNPKNAPNDIEMAALQFFEEKVKAGETLPPYYVQKIPGEKKTTFYYYRPLEINELCLGCHGNPQAMDQNLVSKLQELYPDDKAVGYEEGDFRGVIRVKIPEELIGRG